jgi:NAD(P)-dependent dehydrogenase (short-subunit alcohol dehydrogenase family)
MPLNRRHFLQAATAAAVTAPMAGCTEYADRPKAEAVPGTPIPGTSNFNGDSTAEQVTAGLDLTGKNILITGCNSGIGFETMRVLALRGAHVLGTGRTLAKAEAAKAQVQSMLVGKSNANITPLACELTDFDNVRSCAEQVNRLGIPLDGLILNAGIMGLQELEQVPVKSFSGKSSSGNVQLLEKQFVVNHLGHFVLANSLLESVKASAAGRVVSVSSAAAYMWAPDQGIWFDNLAGEREYSWQWAYGQSKLANALFARELARRLHASGSSATANSLHPGGIATNLKRHMPGYQQWLVNTFGGLFMKTMEQGTATTCYVATNPQLKGVTGYFFGDCNPSYPDGFVEDDAMARELWRVSEGLVG